MREGLRKRRSRRTRRQRGRKRTTLSSANSGIEPGSPAGQHFLFFSPREKRVSTSNQPHPMLLRRRAQRPNTLTLRLLHLESVLRLRRPANPFSILAELVRRVGGVEDFLYHPKKREVRIGQRRWREVGEEGDVPAERPSLACSLLRRP
jgi:hypothetical protein